MVSTGSSNGFSVLRLFPECILHLNAIRKMLSGERDGPRSLLAGGSKTGGLVVAGRFVCGQLVMGGKLVAGQ